MIERERTIITENEWAMRVMQSNQMNDVPRWVEGYRIQVANLNTDIERLREHNTLLKDKAHDRIRWYEGEMKKMGPALGMVTSTLAQVLSHHAVCNWTSCFYEPPVAPAVDPSTVDVPAVLYAARGALNNPGLVTGKVGERYCCPLAGGDVHVRAITREAEMDVKPSGVTRIGTINKTGPVQHWNLGIGPINCHAWNNNRSQVAVCASSYEVRILEWKNGEWVTIHVLNEHDLPVTGIDWAPETNKIVTSSQDKNAFVWTFENITWKPELVVVFSLRRVV